MKVKYYEITHKPTNTKHQFYGKNFKEACKAAGFKPTDCHLVYACEVKEEKV